MASKILYVFIERLKDSKSHLQEDCEGLDYSAREKAGGILDGGCLVEVNLVWTVLFRNFLVSIAAKI